MSLIDIIFLAIALGIDCLLVSFSQGLVVKANRVKISFKLAFVMGLFQACMPIIGYIGTDYMYKLVVPYSKWIVFGIFLILGLKFIIESFVKEKEEVEHISNRSIVSMGIATSIDALVSGASIRLTNCELILTIFIIGFVSYVMSLCGFWSGNLLGKNQSKCQIVGGILLIFLAIKSLI